LLVWFFSHVYSACDVGNDCFSPFYRCPQKIWRKRRFFNYLFNPTDAEKSRIMKSKR
jgi:hypothetical protein